MIITVDIDSGEQNSISTEKIVNINATVLFNTNAGLLFF